MKKILLVDDDNDFRETLAIVLKDAGFLVAEAKDGCDASKELEKSSFDLAIIDIIMPKKNGYELIKELKGNCISIIAISGGGQFADVGSLLPVAKLAGADEVLKKPFTGEKIIELIKKTIGKIKTPSRVSVKKRSIKVLIVEDSPVKSELLTNILNSDTNIEVISSATSCDEVMAILKSTKPDIITMDINLPGLNGFQTTEKILRKYSIPIVIISSIRNINNNAELMEAMRRCGSLYFLDSPPYPGSSEYKKASQEIIRTVKLMSGVAAPIREPFSKTSYTNIPKVTYISSSPNTPENYDHLKMVAIGSSTGGPVVLKKILSGIPANYPYPIVIAQHIGSSFDSSFVKYLNSICKLKVKLAEHAKRVLPGYVYVAPGSKIIEIDKFHNFKISDPTKGQIYQPSISSLFKSVADSYLNSAVGILLTGMGKDGAKELKLMKDKGALTIVQNKESCVIFGMPGEAVKLEAFKKILSPEQILDLLLLLG